MVVGHCRLHQLNLPFRFTLAHASASRAASDSLVVELESDGARGFGEAVLRAYVGGLPPGDSPLETAARATASILSELQGRDWPEAKRVLETYPVAPWQRPILGAVEAAWMSLECDRRGTNLFGLLGLEPKRNRIRYGAILPMLPREAVAALLQQMRAFGLASVRIKLGREPAYNEAVLSLARQTLGPESVLRVDANSAWGADTAPTHLALCRRHGVVHVEDPVPAAEMESLAGCREAEGLVFVADETFVSETDLRSIAREGLYGMINLRLSKNGGLLRTLAMAREAASLGLAYCLGCHVGETGILSSLGRTAAALLEAPAFVDGSYDSQLLAANVTTCDFDFGPGGWATVPEESGVGYCVDPAKLAMHCVASHEVGLPG